jgi:signal transduction histidine kinase
MSRRVTTGSSLPPLAKLGTPRGQTSDGGVGENAPRAVPSARERRTNGQRGAAVEAAGVVATPEGEVPAVVQEKILAEIAHELGNFFHKLYYWSDYLKERPTRKNADSTAAQMLERTIKNLEEFLNVSLDYFRPTQLALMHMSVPEVVEGFVCQARTQLNGTPITVVQSEEWKGQEVMVDPSHLSRAFGFALRHVTKQVGAESAIAIRIAHGGSRDGTDLEIALELHQPNEASPLFRASEAGMEWAVAQKIISLHGGDLLADAQGTNEKTLRIVLPLCP